MNSKFGNLALRILKKCPGDIFLEKQPRKFLGLERATTPGSPNTHRLWGGAIAEWLRTLENSPGGLFSREAGERSELARRGRERRSKICCEADAVKNQVLNSFVYR